MLKSLKLVFLSKSLTEQILKKCNVKIYNLDVQYNRQC